MTTFTNTLSGQTQRRRQPSHRNAVMKRVFLVVVLAFTFLILGSVTGIAVDVARAADKIADRVVLFVHVAMLYSAEPDQKLVMPVKGVAKTGVANTWHAPRDRDRLHEGQDIFAEKGTPVLSATTGYIVKIGENTLGGQTVSVAGAGGRVYYYAHLNDYAPHIAVGDYVTTNTLLGYVGTTGNAAGTPPHLHFGVYAPGGAINPLPLLSDRFQPKSSIPSTKTH
jgi:peptidoglycan LD-endopeptidase LytH